MGALWLRFLKEINANSRTFPQEFQDNPEVALAVELAQESAYTAAELVSYDYYLDALSVEKTVRVDSFVEGKAEGKTEGKAEGEENKARTVAKNLINMNTPLEDVAKATELSIDVVQQLMKDIKATDKK